MLYCPVKLVVYWYVKRVVYCHVKLVVYWYVKRVVYCHVNRVIYWYVKRVVYCHVKHVVYWHVKRVVYGHVKLASMRVKLIQLKDEMEESVEKEDFQRAAELKLSITELEISRQSLVSDAEPQTAEVRTEKVDIIVIHLMYCSSTS